MKRLLISITVVLLLSGTILTAGEADKPADQSQPRWEDKNAKRLAHTQDRLNDLREEWHLANLEGNVSHRNHCERLIIHLLTNDIDSSSSYLRGRLRAASAADIEPDRPESGAPRIIDEERDLQQMEVLLRAKKRVLRSIRQSGSFSARLRLIGDYGELLKRERRVIRTEWAGSPTETEPDE